MADVSYLERLNRERTLLIRDTLRELPRACSDFILSIEPTTTALTRLGYARDLRLFFRFLQSEVTGFDQAIDQWTDEDFARITARHINQFLEYLTYYQNEQDMEFTNAELGKMRKLATLRSFYKYLFKTERVPADVSALVDMPKRREKPILRLEIDEVARLLDAAESGNSLTERQQKYHYFTKIRDLTILTLFLGTGIRVSECVGINLQDIDFEINGFLVTRKGENQVILYFPDEVARQLKIYMAWRGEQSPLPGHEEALFLSMQRKRISMRAVENMVKKYALLVAPLKKRLSPHKLRSTFGTNLYNETGDIYLVADVLGHSDVNTTRRHYAAMADERRRMAVKSVVLREKASEREEGGASPLSES